MKVNSVTSYRTGSLTETHFLVGMVDCDHCNGKGYHVTYSGPDRDEDVGCDECDATGEVEIELEGEQALRVALETDTTTIARELRDLGLGVEASQWEEKAAAQANDLTKLADEVWTVLEAHQRMLLRMEVEHLGVEHVTTVVREVVEAKTMKGAA